MYKIFFLILIMLLTSHCITAQQTKLLSIEGLGTNASDQIDKHVIRTDDGGAIIRISSQLFTNGNVPDCHPPGIIAYQRLFRKYDVAGVFQWERCYKPASVLTDTATNYIFPSGNGNFYTIGVHGVPGGWPKYILCYEDGGQNKIWCADSSFGGAQGLEFLSTCRADDGGFYLAFWSFNSGGDVTTHYGSTQWQDIWLLKLDSLGNRLWSKTIGGTGVDVPTRVLPAPGGGCYLAGYTDSYDYDFIGGYGKVDAFLAKIDNAGNINWQRCVGGSNHDYAHDACFDGKGGVYIAGSTLSIDGLSINNHGGNGIFDYFLVRIDSTGTVLWSNCYGAPAYYEVAYAVCSSSDGTVWITGGSGGKGGQVDTSFEKGDTWTVRADSNGNFLSAKVLGASKQDEGKMIYEIQGGIMVIGGEYDGGGPPGGEFPDHYLGNSDIFLAKLAPWTTSVQEVKVTGIRCKIYPNPAEQIIHIEMQEQGTKQFQMRLVNAEGKTIYKDRIGAQEKLAIPAQGFARGVYYLSIKNAQQQHSEKIILR